MATGQFTRIVRKKLVVSSVHRCAKRSFSSRADGDEEKKPTGIPRYEIMNVETVDLVLDQVRSKRDLF